MQNSERLTHEYLTIVDHPLVQHKLTLLRDKDTPSILFRQALREVALILGVEAMKDLPLGEIEIETPLETMLAPRLDGKKLCFVSVLRAGNGIVDGLMELVPSARVGHLGFYRDEETLQPVQYCCKLPGELAKRQVYLVDPMLATGGTANAAAALLKEKGATRIKMISLVAAPEGVEAFSKEHPDIPIVTAALDRQLNERGYIMPGLGDAGDRIYGTQEKG